MGKKVKMGKPLAAIIIIILIFGVITGLHFLEKKFENFKVFQGWENSSYDMRVRFWANTIYSRPADEIVVIILDEASVNWAQQERGWGWPFPRQAYAEIVEYFNIAGAKSIAFDILYTEPSIYRNARQDEIIDNMNNNLVAIQSAIAEGQGRTAGPLFFSITRDLRSLSARQDDSSFIEASREAGNVVQAVMISDQRGTVKKWPSGYDIPLFQPEGFGSMLEHFGFGNDEEALFPIPGLIESAGALGSVTSKPDFDGFYRRLKPFTMFDGRAVPSLSSASLMVSGMGQQIIYDEKSGIVQWENISIPVNKEGSALLRFRGGLEKYNPYRVSDIMKSLEAIKNREKPDLDPAYFADTHVFVGVFGEGFYDFFATPISTVYPGVGAHVTMLDNMLMGDFIRESKEWLNILILLIVVVIAVLFTLFSQRISADVIGTALTCLVIFIGAFAAYQFAGLWVPIVIFLIGTIISFITVSLYKFFTEGSQKRFIKSAFSQYLSPKVIDQIIADPSQLKLGGEKREMTAIFTDIRGFSTFSEALGDPSQLVELLNFYLTKMSNVVLENQGTIDKYEGDAIIAFFGAPIHYENHASLACRAAIGMKKAEPAMNREAIKTGLVTPAVMEAMYKKGLTKSLDDPCQIFTRIGLNTGDMVVGNMGTPNKMDYTIMGNAVNLAARLEGINKQYDTGGILISEYTRSCIGDEFITRPLSRVRVVGINTPVRLYELLDFASGAKPELLEMVKNWTHAFDLYENRDFAGARELFGSICAKKPDDMAAKKYLGRCIKYISAPPDEKAWDNGVDNLTEK